MRQFIFLAVLFCSLLHVSGLRTTPGSPCEDRCKKQGPTTNTTSSEISCLDVQYNSTSVGEDFKDCTTCLLESEFAIFSSGESDVQWALYNLRFAASSCIFGEPVSSSNVSSPCPVACDDVKDAVIYDIADPAVNNLNDWCSVSSFADNVINECEFCYNLTTNQIFLGNFLESIRYNCHFKTNTGASFAISPTRIFRSVLLPSSLSLTTSTPSGSHVNLGLVIALPILAFVIILLGCTTCCFFFIRHRRKRVRGNRFQNHLYARWNDHTISTPQQGPAGFDQKTYHDQLMYSQMHGGLTSPGGFSGYGSPISPQQNYGLGLATPFSPYHDQKGEEGHEMYGYYTQPTMQPVPENIPPQSAGLGSVPVPGPHAGPDQVPIPGPHAGPDNRINE